MRYFDAHCHIQFPPYEEDRDALLHSMQERGVGGIIVGVDKDSSQKALELSDGKTLFASVGLHPNDTPDEVFDEAWYEALSQDSRVVAIGECGLDYYRPEEPEQEKARQQEVFRKHIALAARADKPLMIHARPSKGTMDAYEDALTLLEEGKQLYGDTVRGNMHFFVGNVESMERLAALGMTFSFTAVLTFTKEYDEVVKRIPREKLITETDAPYVAPVHERGKRNTPLAVEAVVEAIARIRGEEVEEVRAYTLENARRAFALP